MIDQSEEISLGKLGQKGFTNLEIKKMEIYPNIGLALSTFIKTKPST